MPPSLVTRCVKRKQERFPRCMEAFLSITRGGGRQTLTKHAISENLVWIWKPVANRGRDLASPLYFHVPNRLQSSLSANKQRHHPTSYVNLPSCLTQLPPLSTSRSSSASSSSWPFFDDRRLRSCGGRRYVRPFRIGRALEVPGS